MTGVGAVLDANAKKITLLYDGIGRRHHGELSKKNNEQLAVILDYLTSARDATRAATHTIRRKDRGTPTGHPG